MYQKFAYFCIIFISLFDVCYFSKSFDVEAIARKSALNAVDRVRSKITTTPSSSLNSSDFFDSRNDKAIMRTMAIIEAKSSEGRIILLFCDQECPKERNDISLWIREFNTNNDIPQNDGIGFHYHRRRMRFGYHNVDELLDINPIVTIYFVANKAFVYNGSVNSQNEFNDFLMNIEKQPIEKPSNWQGLNDIINAAFECDTSQKYVLRIHSLTECFDELWGNLARSFHSHKNITFVELRHPLTPEETVIIQQRLPKLRRGECQILALLHNGAYLEIFDNNNMFLKELNKKISNWFNENCTQPQPYEIQMPLTDIQLDYLSEELYIYALETNPTYIVVGAIGGIAVIALAISIFWGLNGSSFVTKQ